MGLYLWNCYLSFLTTLTNLNAKGKGLVVDPSCAHRGVVITIKQAQKMTGMEKSSRGDRGFSFDWYHTRADSKNDCRY